MTGPIPVSSMIERPNLLATVQNSYAFGAQIRQQKQAEERKNKLAGIAEQAYTAAPEQRNALVGQAVGVDPESGLALGSALGKRDDAQMDSEDAKAKRLRGAAKYMLQAIESNDPAKIQGAHTAVGQFMSTHGQPFPPQYTPDMLPKLQEALARTAYLDEIESNSKLPADILTLQMLQADPELMQIDRERRQAGWKPTLFQDQNGFNAFMPQTQTGVPVRGAYSGQQGAPMPQGGQQGPIVSEGQQITPFAPDVNIPQSSAEYAAFQAAAADADSPNPTGQPFKVGQVPDKAFHAPPGANTFG
ncbi:MAG: hypothetical protein ACRCYS_15395, partial [Beijerinckiaceae bacterium]